MIEIKINKGPESCSACEQALQHGQEQATCEACGRTFHQTCWDETSGCKDCPSAPTEPPAPAGELEPVVDPVEPIDAVHPRENEPPRWLDDPRNVKKMLKVFWALCAVLVLVDLLDPLGLYDRHAHFPLEGIPGFYAFYGFVACTCLVFMAKVLRKVVMREEDYYDRG